ncbi:MAG: prepilin peptidase [Pseudomonadota bacterium]|nr:prepilin peptidase [Pseudomonadota bacterium]
MLWLIRIIAAIALILAGCHDLKNREIPNSYPLLLALLVMPAVLLAENDGIINAMLFPLLVGFVALVAGIMLWLPGWLGGGDVKLNAAVCMWCASAAHLPRYLLLMTILGGILALFQIITARHATGQAARWLDPERGVPYGLAIAGAALISLPWLPS